MPCFISEYAVLMEIKYTIQKFGVVRIKKIDHGYFCSARTHSIDQEIHNKDNHNITKDFVSNKCFSNELSINQRIFGKSIILLFKTMQK